MSTVLYIDGRNFLGKLEDVFEMAKVKTPDWHAYNFSGLLNRVLEGIKMNRKVFYFAKIKEHPETKEKSKELIENRRLLKTHLEHQGFEVVLTGAVRGHAKEIKGKSILVFKEKGVDVRIAVDMVSNACDGGLKTAIIGSSDSDLQPAVREVTRRAVECIYLGFEFQPNKGLTATTKRTILIRNSEVLEFKQELPL